MDLLISHIRDLADRCYRQNIYTFSDFLTLAEQSDVLAIEKEFSHVPMTLFGGIDGCERRMVRFGSEEMLGYDGPFPIKCILIRPLAPKFSDNLTHRDFLGALMNLGIDRSIIGDIIVKDNTACVFCEENMADYICENITRIRHTQVSCVATDECPEEARPSFASLDLVISSNRCDSIVGGVFRISRSKSAQLFAGKCVFIDGRQCDNGSTRLKEGATVSVRGYGKFIFDSEVGETRKGRVHITVRQYT